MPDTASSFDAAGKLARLFMCLACLTIVFLICPIDCQGCSAGSFGPHCNYSCSNCYDTARCLNFNNLTGGCSDQICTKGFANPPLCQIPCGTGIYMDRFGFNCSFRCHCNGSTGCDPVSGNCNSGCHPAWIGPGCQTQLPKMSQPPNITGNDCSGLTVSFLRFNSSVDEGVDSVEFYRLQTDNGTNDVLWYIVQDFLQVVADPYKVTLPFESLNASYSYRFRVIAKFKDPFFTNFFGPASPPSSAVKPVCVPTPGVPPMGSFAVAVVGSGLRATWNASLTPTIVNYNITVTPLRTGDCANLTGPVTNRLVPVGEQVFNYSGEPWTTYQVSAFSTTRLGEVSPTVTSSYITDPAKPITPVTIRLLGKGTDWLNFTWSPPSCSERRGLIQQYQYYVFEISGSDSLVKSKDTPATVQEVPLSNLTPFTTYNISVNYITLGTSPDAVLSVTTDAALGPDPPTNINVASITSTSATISWSPPTAPKAPIADYIVKVISPVSITHIATGVSVELVNLTSATAYTVQVHSRSINGSVGLASTSTIFTTLASPQQVASLENSSRSSSTIILSWSAPSDTANLAQFRIVYTLLESKAPGVSAGASSTINETAAARTRSVTGLQPASHYTLCVTPVYNSSTSGVQRCNNAWTTPGVFAAPPAAPALLGAAGVTSANISLTAAATYTGGPLTAYVLGLQLTSSSPGRRRRRAVAPGSVDLAGYTIIAEFSPVGLPAAFLIGDGRSYGGYANPGLSPSSVYNVRLAAYSLVDGVYASAASSPLAISSLAAPAASTAAPTPAGSSSNNTGLIVGLVILFIILLAAIAVGLYFYISRVLRPNSGKDYAAAYYSNGASQLDGGLGGGKGSEPRTADCWSAINSMTDSRRLLVEPGNYRAHVSVMSCGTGVTCYEEFSALPQGYSPNRTCHTARNAANVTRNRSVQNLPYDRNLVRFKDTNVYYNACYVDGYIRRKAYISAQSPIDKESAGDFWRIVAEQNVAQIVTLCLEFEAKSLHCIKYWPDVGNRAEFNGIQVRCLTEEYRNFYCKRSFKVNKLDVAQYQFLCWPETGMPKTALPLIALYYAVKVASCIEDGPLLVHCSTALSRTAIFISLDFLLQQAMHEQSVSVFKCASHLRKSRANSLPDPREYAFIYDLLFEAMLTEGRNIVRLDVREHLRSLQALNPKLNQTHMWEHFAYLQNYTERPSCTSPTAGQADRDPDIMPCNDCRVRLADPAAYINAIWLDGFYSADDTIVTQTPLEWTELAFWTMVLEHRASHVVDLQPGGDPSRCFYPQPPETQRSLGQGGFTLRLQGRTDEGCTLLLECPGAQPLPVTVHACSGLYGSQTDNSLPQSPKAMLRAVENFLQSPAPRSGPQILVCLNGANRCGLFAACLLAAQQLQHEGYTDVYHLVKWMKLRRPQLVANLGQYEFIFKFLAYYAKRKLLPEPQAEAKQRQLLENTDTLAIGETVYSHSQLPVQQQQEPGRVAYHYLGQGDLGATLMSTASADLV